MCVFFLHLASPYRVYPPVTQKLARLWTQYCEVIMKVKYVHLFFVVYANVPRLMLFFIV